MALTQEITAILEAIQTIVKAAVPDFHVTDINKASTQLSTSQKPAFIIAEMGEEDVVDRVCSTTYIYTRIGIRQLYMDSEENALKRDMLMFDAIGADKKLGGTAINSNWLPADRPFNWPTKGSTKWRDRYLSVKYRRDDTS